MVRSMADFDWKKFTWPKGIGAVVVLGIVLLILWRVPQWQVGDVEADPYQHAKLEDEYRRTLIQGIGGFFLLVGLYVSWLRVKATEENVRVAQENVGVAQENVRVAQENVGVAQENVGVAQENVRVAEEGQVTERFTRAIEQLGQEGDDKMAIRLGGIYALERIAKDSEKDHGPVMEVLTAYVRESASRQEEAKPPPTDIQAILTVIGRRETTGDNRGNDRLDLTRTRLVGADLREATLVMTTLSAADLRKADLRKATLVMTTLSAANLSGADLREANLSEADLREATLSAANLRGADLRKATLHEAILSRANLSKTRLSGTTLSGADLRGADLSGANLSGANLSGANLSRANLSGANLSAATLREANLVMTILRAAENLTAEQVQTAANWRNALLPGYLNLSKPPDPAA